MISIVTPVTVMRAMNRTPAALMMVHSTMVMRAQDDAVGRADTDSGSMSSPTSWKPLQIGGSTVCMAMASAAID